MLEPFQFTTLPWTSSCLSSEFFPDHHQMPQQPLVTGQCVGQGQFWTPQPSKNVMFAESGTCLALYESLQLQI